MSKPPLLLQCFVGPVNQVSGLLNPWNPYDAVICVCQSGGIEHRDLLLSSSTNTLIVGLQVQVDLSNPVIPGKEHLVWFRRPFFTKNLSLGDFGIDP